MDEEFSNEVLLEAFRANTHHLTESLNVKYVIDRLFGKKIISDDDYELFINEHQFLTRADRTRKLISVLFKTGNSETFTVLYNAIKEREHISHILDPIKKECYRILREQHSPENRRSRSSYYSYADVAPTSPTQRRLSSQSSTEAAISKTFLLIKTSLESNIDFVIDRLFECKKITPKQFCTLLAAADHERAEKLMASLGESQRQFVFVLLLQALQSQTQTDQSKEIYGAIISEYANLSQEQCLSDNHSHPENQFSRQTSSTSLQYPSTPDPQSEEQLIKANMTKSLDIFEPLFANSRSVINGLCCRGIISTQVAKKLNAAKNPGEAVRGLFEALSTAPTVPNPFTLLRAEILKSASANSTYQSLKYDKDGKLFNDDVTSSVEESGYYDDTTSFEKHDTYYVASKQLQIANLCQPNRGKLEVSLKEGGHVHAISVLNRELFIIRRDLGHIEAVDTSTLKPRVPIPITDIDWVTDMAACHRNQSLFISDSKQKQVIRVDLSSRSSPVISRWSVGDMTPISISVCQNGNVVITYHSAQLAKIFSPTGTFIQKLVIQKDIVNPWQTVEMSPGQYLVCHGDRKDPLNRVCLIDSKGQIVKSDKSSSRAIRVPIRLIVHGFVFVADAYNRRVVMLSPSSLAPVREVVSGLRDVSRIALDPDIGRLFIADNKYEKTQYVSGQVHVCDLTC